MEDTSAHCHVALRCELQHLITMAPVVDTTVLCSKRGHVGVVVPPGLRHKHVQLNDRNYITLQPVLPTGSGTGHHGTR